MDELPGFSLPSVAEKDALIVDLWHLVRKLTAQVGTLETKVQELEGRLARNSRNSGKPPSPDGLGKPDPESLSKTGAHPGGGQKGHAGHTPKKVEAPNRTEIHRPAPHCDACGACLGETTAVETRQVFDLPKLSSGVTGHRVLAGNCAACGKVCRGGFPPGVVAPVQYGPGALAAAVHPTHHHMMPVQRTAAPTGDFSGLPTSGATVRGAGEEAKIRLQPTVEAIGKAIQTAPVARADETGMRVAGKLHWMRVLATETPTRVACHAKRGKQAFDDLAMLTGFPGTLVHDGWKPCRDLRCQHGSCNAHHLRELTCVLEEFEQARAGRMIDLLSAACHEANTVAHPVSAERITGWRSRYEEILSAGEAVNPPAEKSGKRGRTRQSKPANLPLRLRTYADDAWRFATGHNAPFTNNLAEQAVRVPKVKQKISGGFRTKKGADNFCTIRPYLATLYKQGDNLFPALTSTFQGQTPQPRFA
ncbi:MAG: IS66 family transposase [Betaproteobacteria bacterium]|nr:IS66 family transposase [Betaproteobacteria bacterium]